MSDDREDSKDEERRRIVHDLRAPLHALTGFLDLAISDNSDPEVARLLDAAHRSALRLNELVAELDGEEDIPVDVDLHALVNEVLELLAPITGSHSIGLVGGPGPEVNVPNRTLRRVVSNLIVNAVRHTPTGSQITITTEAESLRIIIDDEGLGPSAIVEGGHDHSRLGLVIVGELLERIGGRLDIEQRHPVGSRIVVSLPDSCRQM